MFFRPSGAGRCAVRDTHGLRHGLHSSAASRLRRLSRKTIQLCHCPDERNQDAVTDVTEANSRFQNGNSFGMLSEQLITDAIRDRHGPFQKKKRGRKKEGERREAATLPRVISQVETSRNAQEEGKPRSGERMQPTAQAVGTEPEKKPAPEGRKKRRE